jgi:hypothetical protein
MRKPQQRQILELIQTLEEAQALKMYANCQNCALRIGEFIEHIEGKGGGGRTVALLREYHELLREASTGEIGEEPLLKHLSELEDSVNSELAPDRLEIVFFPYQLSMFDAFESVYLAARADPNCDVYVVPIPWYELNPDGAFGRMHYDGDSYPDDIPVTDWLKYDVEGRRPDVIFIHYPYDDNVNNASIHPVFYSKRLRAFTDLLCYIPYFVALGDTVEEYYGRLPGVIYAHRVIVQSEAVRQSYIGHYEKFDRELGWQGRFGRAEEKFVALGSPKFDKVIHTNRENTPLPEEWRKRIDRSDGTARKVVLYNTHMFAWINGGEAYFKKLRFVFDLFRGREEVVLWWRPHPNTELNFRTKRPRFLDEYTSLIADYQCGDWGIYDDTPDLHRAIAWSDAYYGDWSSLVSMYQLTGKPIMTGNIEQLQNELRFLPTCIYVDDNDIWVSVRRINALFKMSRKSWEPRFVGSFPGETGYAAQFDTSLYQEPDENKGVIYFPPFQAKEIAAYSVAENTFTKFAYKKSGSEEEYHRDFCGSIAYGDHIYLTPYLYPSIARLDPATKEVDYYSDWVEPLKKLMSYVQDAFFLFPLAAGQSIWLAACGANAVVEFNMDTQISTIHEVGKKGYRYNGICFDGENYWLTPRYNTTTPVVKWNPKTGNIKEYAEIYLDDGEQHGFVPMVYGNGFVWLFPLLSRHAYKIDIHSDIVSIAEEFEPVIPDGENAQKGGKYYRPQVFGDSIFVYKEMTGTFIEYDFVTKERREETVRYPLETISQIEPFLVDAFLRDSELMKSVYDGCYYESDATTLSYFLSYLAHETEKHKTYALRDKRREIAKKMNIHMDGMAGQAIYDFTKKTVFG